jgi:N-methylhydantoinase A/oxoprolinase/acetone carboxylase beta subunit
VRANGRWLEALVWPRAALTRTAIVRGPAVLTDAGATLWVAPGWSVRVHASGTLVLTRRGAR